MPKDTKEIYLSSCLPTDMLDEDDMTSSEDVKDHFLQYEFADLVYNIGKLPFKDTYLNFIDDIREQSFLNQQVLCNHIIYQIQKIYNFEFPEKIIISNKNDLNNFYKFVEFLEFDNEDFLVEILQTFNVDLNIVNIKDFCNKNQKEIIRQINFYDLSKLTPIFLNLYDTLENKTFIPIIIRMILKNKEEVNNELKIQKLKKERG